MTRDKNAESRRDLLQDDGPAVKQEGPDSGDQSCWKRERSMPGGRWASKRVVGSHLKTLLSHTSFKSNPQQRLFLQGYSGRPPTSSWPVVPLPRPFVDNCRFVSLPAKSRCVTHLPPSSQLPATHITTRISTPTPGFFHLIVGRRVCLLFLHSALLFSLKHLSARFSFSSSL